VTGAPGTLTYTQMLNKQGGIECDLTVARMAEDLFYIVTGTGFRTHDFSWIARNIPEGLDVTLQDVTEDFGCLSLMGPNARAVLQQVAAQDVSNEALPFLHCRILSIAGVPVRTLRVTYVGELGYELHVPKAGMIKVYHALMQAGAAVGIRNAGYRAIESLRLEKGYRAWGSDINADSTPWEAGLSFAVRKDGVPFQGAEALFAARKSPQKRILTTFTIDNPEIVLLGRETIFRNGEQVGYLTSGGYGYTLATNIGLGYVRRDEGIDKHFILSGSYELEIANVRFPAKAHLAPLYDPQNLRVKG
jgi:sarcosine dehydrogenase